MLQEKRESTEKFLSDNPKPTQESIEERRNRLKAQRDLLVKQKQEKRDKELGEFNEKTKTKDDLHKELLEMDKRLDAKNKFK
jgi:hypothetical protein